MLLPHRKLGGRRSDAACSSMNENDLAFCDLSEVGKSLPARDEAFHDCGRFDEGHPGRNGSRHPAVEPRILGIGPAADNPHDTVADGKAGYFVSDGGHFTSDLEAEYVTVPVSLSTIDAFALKKISAVDTSRHDLDQKIV